MNPPDTIVLGDIPHALRQRLAVGHHKVVVNDGDDVALGGEGTAHLLVDPVLLVLVPNTPVQGSWSTNQEKVLGLADVLEQALVKLACLQA